MERIPWGVPSIFTFRGGDPAVSGWDVDEMLVARAHALLYRVPDAVEMRFGWQGDVFFEREDLSEEGECLRCFD